MRFRQNDILVLVVLGLVLAVCSYVVYSLYQSRSIDSVASDVLVEEVTFDDFETLNGEPFNLNAFSGSVRVVSSWASWCPSCGRQLAALSEASAQFPEVVTVAINRGEQGNIVRRYTNQLPELSDMYVVLDNKDVYYKAIGGYTMPETIVYGPAGEVIFHKRGEISKEELEFYMEKASKKITN